jgi:transcriptional regulator PpsR
MEILAPNVAAKAFTAPEESLGDLGAGTAAALIAAAADLSLVIDKDGVVRDVAFGLPELAREGFDAWVGKPWIDTVTIESRPKIDDMMREATAGKSHRPRQVNHPVEAGPDIPVRYTVMPLGSTGRVVAIGRDLRAMAALQQRLADAQQSMEREYARIRGAETRYRLLFQLASEAIVILDATTLRIVDANPSATRLLTKSMKRVIGQSLVEAFAPSGREQIQGLLAAVRINGRADDVHARLGGIEDEVNVSASLFRQESTSHFLVRVTPLAVGDAELAVPRGRAHILRIIDGLPEGFVVTDPERRVLTANAAFLDMAQLATEEQVRGEPLENWVGRPGVDLDVLYSSLREHGAVRQFSTILRGEFGSQEDVEIAAVSVLSGDQPCMGFTVRNVGWRSGVGALAGRELPRSVEQFTDLVGRVSLKNLVRETTDMIERLCIEAALELTRDNRASAAEMLGLSRQSLYSKLRRYGLGDLEPEENA